MKIPQRYIQLVGLAMGLSGSILGLSYAAYYLDKAGLLGKEFGFGFLLIYVFYVFYMMIRYAISKKD